MHHTRKETGKDGGSRYQEESAEENLLDQILKQEKKILGYDFEPVKLVKRYSDLENARARLVDCLLKRLIRFRRPDSFTILKAEVEYYYQVCDLIYGKDYWD